MNLAAQGQNLPHWELFPQDAVFHTWVGEERSLRCGEQTEVPAPIPRPIPPFWRRVGKSFSHSGTLVVWSELDRCMWRTGDAIIRNSEELIGRMYRRFLHDGRVTIRLVRVAQHDVNDFDESFARPNDPMYLMQSTSCPPPFDNTPMFKPYGDNPEIRYRVRFNGEEQEVVIRFSYAKEEARQGHNPGNQLYGQHVKRNLGVSIMRAERELELSMSWVNQYDPTERWWGVEIEFPPALDELFGVSNNKQYARYLSEAGKIDVERLLLLEESGKTIHQLKDEFARDEDPTGPLLEISQLIHNQLSQIRGLLKTETRATRSPRRHEDPDSPEAVGTKVTRRRQEASYRGKSDESESLPEQERLQQIEEELIESGLPEIQAREIGASTVSTGFKYVFANAELETPAFFSVKPKGGSLIVTLNMAHPAYRWLIEALETQGSENLTI